MTKLVFDKVGERFFEAGVSQGVLFPGSPTNAVKGVAWNGLTSVQDSPDGGDTNDQFADNIKYLSLRGAENVKGTIEAFTYPKEFEPCMGKKGPAKGGYFAQQGKLPFSFAYITQVGNDVDGVDYSEKLHIVWNATVNPTDKSYETINENPEAITFSWEYDTVPVPVKGFKPSAGFEYEKTAENAETYNAIIDALYGTDETESHLLMPDDIVEMLK